MKNNILMQYIKFMVGYYILPTTLSFHILTQYVDWFVAYNISIIVWGTIFFAYNKIIHKNNTQ